MLSLERANVSIQLILHYENKIKKLPYQFIN